MSENTGVNVDRGDRLPLYLQVKKVILAKITRGDLPPGSMLPSEKELCEEYRVSRVTIRKAMRELVDEGMIQRTSGRGTFVREDAAHPMTGSRNLGLLVTQVHVEFVGSIVSGFIGHAEESGWLTVLLSSNEDPDRELRGLETLAAAGLGSLAVFPCENSRLSEKDDLFRTDRRHLCLIDREPATSVTYDFVGSDNAGGAYAAVRHLQSRGFSTAAFLSHKSDISSIRQRLDGFLSAAADFSLPVVGTPGAGGAGTHYKQDQRLFIEDLSGHLKLLKKRLPLGIVAVNDKTALDCIELLRGAGMVVGKDVGVVGFDNEPPGKFSDPPLTSVAQNGQLIGKTAAHIAIERLQGGNAQRQRVVLPTQIILRRSCGE